MYGHGIPMGGITGLMIIIVLGIVIYRLVKGSPEDSREGSNAKDILDERYARGEISSEEYLEQKKNLES